MAFYILLLCGLICSSCCVSFARDKFFVKIFQVVTFLILYLPAAFRYGIGTDYPNYVNIFRGVSHGGALYVEPGWWLLNRWVYMLGGSAQNLIALVAFLTYFFMLCEVEPKKWFIYVPVFFMIIYAWTFTTLRQMLAMSMCFFSLCRIQKKKYFLAIIFSVLSFFIHKSVLLYPVIYVLLQIFSFKKLTGIVLIFFAYVISVILGPIIKNMFLILTTLTAYASYGESDWVNAAEVSTGLGRLLRYMVYFTLVIFSPKNIAKSKLFTLLLLYIVIDFFSQSIVILNRVGRGVIFLFLPLAWAVYKNRKKYDISVFIYNCCYLLLFLLELYGGFQNSVPYISTFS